jgi:DNA-binding transcriptional regulator YhcF (GntR family)
MEDAIPPYARIVAELRRRIRAGELRAGDRVPSTRQITGEWGVAMATATKVLTTLRREGLVRAVPGVGTLVEGPPQSASPRPTRDSDLSREVIVRAATAIADQEGLSGLSMRHVAGDLGVATMSLYRHVGGKDELLLLMADAAFGVDAFPAEPPPGWRAQLEVAARLQWSTYLRHPWLPHVVSVTRPQALPNLIGHSEWALRAVDGLGLDASTMLYVLITVFNHVRGTAMNLEAEAQAQQDTGMDIDQWIETQTAAMAEIIGEGDVPTFAAVTSLDDFDFDLDALFEFGLGRLLDGLAVFLGCATAGGSGPGSA